MRYSDTGGCFEVSIIFLVQRDGVFFISGDVHFGEITRYDCTVGYPLYDITSSGLTQAVEKVVPTPLHFMVIFLAWLTPSTMRVMGPNCRFRSCTYGMLVIFELLVNLPFRKFHEILFCSCMYYFLIGQQNFGAVEIDWDASPVAMKIEVRDTDGILVTGVNISLSELQAHSMNSTATSKVGKDQRHCSLEVSLPWIVRYRLAIFLYCFVAGMFFLILCSICFECIMQII